MNRYGVVGVIEAILLVALFAIILATIQLTYIPSLMENREAEHMSTVSNQFSQLKLAIDLHSVSRSNFSISVPLTLGSREIPYLVTARSLGEVSIIENAFKISVKTASGYSNFSLGIIRYNANNVYYVRQSYILECGAVLLRQSGSYDSMLSPPTFSAKKSGNTISLSLLAVNISSYANRTTESGLDTTYIRTNYSSMSSFDFQDIESLTIYTYYPDPWFRFLNYSIDNCSVTEYDNRVVVEPESGYQMDLHLDVIKIYAQIGRGWIGNL